MVWPIIFYGGILCVWPILYYIAKLFNIFNIQHDLKKRSWILSWIISILTSLYGIVFVLPKIIPMNSNEFMLFCLSESYASKNLAWIFISFCLSDLMCGYIDYFNQIKFLEGWIHHTFYICILLVFLSLKMTNAFYAFLWCEIPTLIMSTGILIPKLKFPFLFIFTFIMFRIIGYTYYALAFMFHCTWYVWIFSLPVALLIGGAHYFWIWKLLFK